MADLSGKMKGKTMEKSDNSWLRRTTFSHTVCHRWGSTLLGSISCTIKQKRISGVKSRRGGDSCNQKSQHGHVTNKLWTSHLPESVGSDAFKEVEGLAPPHSPRKESEKGITTKVSHKKKSKASDYKSYSTSITLMQLPFTNVYEKSMTWKDSSWRKCFDSGEGRITAVETAEEHTIDLSQLFLGLRFAHGAHSRLYHGMYKDEVVAVKIITVPDDDANGNLAARLEKQYNSEVSLLSRLHHQNVIKFVAARRQPPVYCVIMEYLSEGSLRAYLHKLETKSLPLQKLIAFGLDIARGMEYIHSQGVIHRDLKPDNILIDENSHLKIADFGIACEDTYCETLAEDSGTYRWMAPEMIKHKSYGRKVDVYSFGLILWEMVAGTIPYEDMNPLQAAYAVVNKNMRPVIPSKCPHVLRALIEQCWSLQPEKRPNFWQIVEVLEQFESSVAHDGTLNSVQNLYFQDYKKGLLQRIHKICPMPPSI